MSLVHHDLGLGKLGYVGLDARDPINQPTIQAGQIVIRRQSQRGAWSMEGDVRGPEAAVQSPVCTETDAGCQERGVIKKSEQRGAFVADPGVRSRSWHVSTQT